MAQRLYEDDLSFRKYAVLRRVASTNIKQTEWGLFFSSFLYDLTTESSAPLKMTTPDFHKAKRNGSLRFMRWLSSATKGVRLVGYDEEEKLVL